MIIADSKQCRNDDDEMGIGVASQSVSLARTRSM